MRRADYVDEAFAGGKWQPTKAIVDYLFGHNDFVDDVSEAEARRIGGSPPRLSCCPHPTEVIPLEPAAVREWLAKR